MAGRNTRQDLDRAAWQTLWGELDALLAPLVNAGWALPDDADLDSFAEVDPESGPVLWLVLRRTGMYLGVTWIPARRTLELKPYENPTGGWVDDDCDTDGLGEYSLLAEAETVRLDAGQPTDIAPIATAAQRLGLLDATRIAVCDGTGTTTSEFVADRYAHFLFGGAAEWREEGLAEAAKALQHDETSAKPSAGCLSLPAGCCLTRSPQRLHLASPHGAGATTPTSNAGMGNWTPYPTW